MKKNIFLAVLMIVLMQLLGSFSVVAQSKVLEGIEDIRLKNAGAITDGI